MQKIKLDDDQKLMLSGKLQLIQNGITARPEVQITFFQPNAKKEGGAYVSVTETVKKVNEYKCLIMMANEKTIPIDEVIAIDGELFRGMDDTFWELQLSFRG